MKLKTVIFYQGVKLWDNNLYSTVLSGPGTGRMEGISINLVDHIVTVSKEGEEWDVVVGTANMRSGTVDNGYLKPIAEIAEEAMAQESYEELKEKRARKKK